MPTFILVFSEIVEYFESVEGNLLYYAHYNMETETLLVTLFFTFVIGAGIGFYATSLIF